MIRDQKQMSNLQVKHVVVLPYPAQGHVMPMMELSQALLKQGLKITFITTALTRKQLLNSLGGEESIHLASVLDELENPEKRKDFLQMGDAINREMPWKLEKLIRDMNASEDNKISAMIADTTLGWAQDLARKLGLRRVAFQPASALGLVLCWSIPKLILDGVIDKDGSALKNEMAQLAPEIPPLHPSDFFWNRVSKELQELTFNLMAQGHETLKSADFIICNSTSLLEPGVFNFAPEILPIGPLLALNSLCHTRTVGSLLPEDSSCLSWLDRQPPRSVIYAAFGSIATFNRRQFEELALGLELTKRPFLWVARSDSTEKTMDHDAYPNGFLGRVSNRGLIVKWAPQQKVLNHPSIGCFLSHCGWNSTIEAIINGVPLLCWPYFSDQFLNMRYVCDVWKIGLGFDERESGIVMGVEIKNKLDQVFDDHKFKEICVNLKEMVLAAIEEGGSSYKNFIHLCNWIKSL